FGKTAIAVTASLAIGSALALGVLRFLIGYGHSGTWLLAVEAIALTLLNVMAFALMTYKFRNGNEDTAARFRRIFDKNARVERALDRFLARLVRWYMDAVLDYYRTQFLVLKAELRKARAPIIRAVAAFRVVESNARTIQDDARA